MLDVVDFLPLYPSTDDSMFIKHLSSLKEFSSLKLTKDAGELPTAAVKGDMESSLLSDQIFFNRAFTQSTPYGSSRGFLVNKEPGTGKTCTASAVIENFKLSEIDESRFKQAIVLVPNNELIKKFRAEVAGRCTREYEVEGSDFLKDSILKRRLKKSLAKTYEIYTHHTFLKRVSTMSNAAIQNTFSNRRIFIDESHAFRYYDIPGSEDDVDASEIGLEDDADKNKTIAKWQARNELYNYLMRLIDNITNSQIFLMTGTPMTNSVTEIASQLNLILPPEQRYPTGRKFKEMFFDKNGQFKQTMIDEFSKRLMGKVSFLREPYVKKTYMGQKAGPWVTLTNVVLLEMSEYQSTEVSRLRAIGKSGIDRKPMSASVSLQNPTRNNITDLAKYSIKFDYVQKLLLEAKRKRECVWIACDFVSSETTGSLTTLSSLLELMGYTHASNSSILSSSGDHYIRIDQDSRDLEALIKAHNDPKNMHGDYNRVIIGGPRAKLGLSLSHIRKVVKLNPDWHKADENQYLARGIRYGSLNALPPNERYTEIHLLCAVKPGFIRAVKDGNIDRDEWDTIDLHIFNVAEIKESEISQVKRLLKSVAMDCAINYNRNVREGDDIDGSRECEYTSCDYTCYIPGDRKGFDPHLIQSNMKVPPSYETNYTILHSDKEIGRLISGIQNIFTTTFTISFDILYRKLKPTNTTVLLLALDEIISGKIKCKNRYGFDNYLHELNNYYFLSPLFERSHYGDHYLVKYPAVTSHIDMSLLLDGFDNDEDSKLLKIGTFCKNPSDNEFQKLSYATRIKLVENIYEKLQTSQLPQPHPPAIRYLLDVARKTISQEPIHFEVGLGQIKSDKDTISAYHRMWYDERRQFQVIKSGAENPKLDSHGLTREFRNGRWVNLSIPVEKMLVALLNERRTGRTKTEGDVEGEEDNKKKEDKKKNKRGGTVSDAHGYSGKRVAGSFKIVRPGGNINGIECSSLKIDALHDIIKDNGMYVRYDDTESVEYTKAELQTKILGNRKLKFTEDELKKFNTRDKLIDIFLYQERVSSTAGNPKKELMCEYIERVLTSAN
jgi:hypothetical protein